MRTDCTGRELPDDMHEYAFDVKLFAVVRVVAPCLDAARDVIDSTVNAMTPSDHWIEGFNSVGRVRITEASLSEDGEDENRLPFEIDGEPT